MKGKTKNNGESRRMNELAGLMIEAREFQMEAMLLARRRSEERRGGEGKEKKRRMEEDMAAYEGVRKVGQEAPTGWIKETKAEEAEGDEVRREGVGEDRESGAQGGRDEPSRNVDNTGVGDEKRKIAVVLSEETVKGNEGELEEEKEQQERIREKRREEQWASIRGRELAAGDRKRAAELGEELAAKLKAGMDGGENETGWVGLGSESGGETMYGPGQRRDRLEISEETEEQERRIRKTERGRDGRIGGVPPWDGREAARAVSNGWKHKKS